MSCVNRANLVYHKHTGFFMIYTVGCKMFEFAARREDLVPDLMTRFGEICSDLRTRERVVPTPEALVYLTSKRTRACACVCAD